jgi:quercetin dioxygenase-like cupin family protein
MAELTPVDELEEAPHAEVFEQRSPRTVRLRLDAGEAVPPHRHPGYDIVLYVIEGAVELRLDDERHTVTPGDAVRFSGERDISPKAVDDATALVVFAPT